MARSLDEDELIEHWTLVGDEQQLLTGRTGPSKLALALWLKFFTQQGRFPDGRSELHDDAVGYVAAQVQVPAWDLGLFDWEGTTAGRHRKLIRQFLDFRECTVPDQEKLTAWLAEEVCSRERRVERVREALLRHMREERIEQPTRLRLGRMIGSALRQAEDTLTMKVASRLDAEVTERMRSLISAASDDPTEQEPEQGDDATAETSPGSAGEDADLAAELGPEVWAAIKSDPGKRQPEHLQDRGAQAALDRGGEAAAAAVP